MAPINTLTGERLHVNHHGPDAITLNVTDPRFGRVATVRLGHDDAVELASALTGLLLDLGHSPATEREPPRHR